MAINARAAERKEAEMAFLKAEDELLKELGKKRKREAAERSAAEKELSELDMGEILEYKYDPMEPIGIGEVLFSEEDREKEKDYPEFGKSFLDILAEDEAKKNKENDLIGAKDYQTLLEQKRKNKEKDLPGYRPGESEESKYLLSPTVRASMQRSENMYNAYKSGEEWLMSDEGGDDLVKGFINNVRSAIGTGVEDFAYWLNDVAPWYTPAKKVVEDNMAGEIEEQAQRNFGNAKANGVNGKFVDAMDDLSKGLGYNVFGFKAGNYVQDGADAFGEYRALRDSGYTKEEATLAMAKKAGLSFVEDKLLDKGGDLLINRIPQRGVYGVRADFETNISPKTLRETTVEDFFGEKKEITYIEYEEILQFKNCKYKMDIKNGVSCFPENDQLYKNIQNVKPIKYGNTGEYCFDIGIHGNPKNVAFSSAKDAPIMTPKALAVSISQNTNYKKGQPVRLLSCSTGKGIPFDDCFAQKLANEINAPVVAPTDILWVFDNGKMEIGKHNQGEWKEFVPIYR